MDQFEIQIKNEFLSEAEELLEKLEDGFLIFEKDLNNKGNIDSLFRIAHTFKGSGHAAGFESLAEVAHHMEQLLDQIRQDRLEVDEELIDVLLKFKDILGDGIEKLMDDHDFELDHVYAASLANEYLKAGDASEKRIESSGFGFFDDEKESQKPPQSDHPTSTKKNFDPYAKPLVLVVDDEPMIADFEADVLSDKGLDVLVAHDGAQALKMFQENAVDTVVSDLRMPGISGYELAREIHQINAEIPFIAVSGFAERDDLVEFIKSGTFYFFDKPIEEADFTSVVLSAVKQSRTKRVFSYLSKLNFRIFSKYYSFLSDPEIKEKYNQEYSEIEALTEEISELTHSNP